MSNREGSFTYESDHEWLVEVATPYYYGITFLLITLNFYTLAFWYVLAGITLIWEVEQYDRMDYEYDYVHRTAASHIHFHKAVDMEILIDFVHNIVVDEPFIYQSSPEFVEFVNNINASSANLPHIKRFNIMFNKSNNVINNNSSGLETIVFNKKNIINVTNQVNNFFIKQDKSYYQILNQVIALKERILLDTNKKNKRKVELRMKKFIKSVKDFDKKLLLFRSSLNSHNVVIYSSFLQVGLYPMSMYDVDMIKYSYFSWIEFSDYALFDNFCQEDFEILEEESDLNVFGELTFYHAALYK